MIERAIELARLAKEAEGERQRQALEESRQRYTEWVHRQLWSILRPEVLEMFEVEIQFGGLGGKKIRLSLKTDDPVFKDWVADTSIDEGIGMVSLNFRNSARYLYVPEVTLRRDQDVQAQLTELGKALAFILEQDALWEANRVKAAEERRAEEERRKAVTAAAREARARAEAKLEAKLAEATARLEQEKQRAAEEIGWPEGFSLTIYELTWPTGYDRDTGEFGESSLYVTDSKPCPEQSEGPEVGRDGECNWWTVISSTGLESRKIVTPMGYQIRPITIDRAEDIPYALCTCRQFSERVEVNEENELWKETASEWARIPPLTYPIGGLAELVRRHRKG